MKKTLTTAAASFAAIALLAGCGESVDREGTVDEIVEGSGGAINETQAECMVDGWIDELGESRALEFNDPDKEPTADEQAAIDQITTDCLVGE